MQLDTIRGTSWSLLSPWLTDENGWPSDACAGRYLGQHQHQMGLGKVKMFPQVAGFKPGSLSKGAYILPLSHHRPLYENIFLS